jgi:hypothetical protein
LGDGEIDPDTASFVSLGDGYAKDNISVFYQGQYLGDGEIDPDTASFVSLGDGYAKDNISVFYQGQYLGFNKIVETGTDSKQLGLNWNIWAIFGW